jgi:hypothetical protein
MNSVHLVLSLPFRLEQALESARGNAPGLLSLLRRGTTLAAETSLAGIACEAFGVARQQDWPLAPISALADGLAPGTDYWLRLDPAHLEVGMGGLMLHPADALLLDNEETAALVSSLNAHWAGRGLELTAPTPTRWYLRLPTAPEISTTPLDAVAGEYLTPHLPRGRDAGRLMGWVNEAQMLLHAHAVNQAREGAGRLPVNGLWLWGGGVLPAMSSRLDAVASGAPEVAALAAAARVPILHAASLETLRDTGRHKKVLATLAPAPEEVDAEGYLAGLERDWFHPLLRGLLLGRIRRVRLDLLARPGRAVSLSPAQAWRFWR